MTLEAELGVDSVKQAELMARVAERYDMPPRLRTSGSATTTRSAKSRTSSTASSAARSRVSRRRRVRDLEGKLALVTGGAKGVGKVVARELAARGAHILLNFFHSLDQAKETKAELEATGATVDLFRASVAQPKQVEKMFAEIEERFGYLDILVNNAASGRRFRSPPSTRMRSPAPSTRTSRAASGVRAPRRR